MIINIEELQKQIDFCDIPVEEILQEHLRTPYKHNITPFAGVPILTGEVAERFDKICQSNAEHFSSSEYDKEKEEWVKNILRKRNK